MACQVAGRPKHRARVVAALARGEPPPLNLRSRTRALTVPEAAEKERLKCLIEPPSGFVTSRCTYRFKSRGKRQGQQCKNSAVWGLDVCVKHGGLSPGKQEELRERLGAMIEFLDPRKLLVLGHQVLDAHVGMISDPDVPGKFLPAKDWPPEIWPAIKSVKILNYNAESGDGKPECVVEVQLHDQARYQELMMRSAGQLLDNLQLSGKLQHEQTVGQEFVDAMVEGLKRAAAAAPRTCPHCHRLYDEVPRPAPGPFPAREPSPTVVKRQVVPHSLARASV